MAVEFCDTNIIIYAHARQEPGKRTVARQLLARITAEYSGVISTQVMLETYAALSRHVPASECANIVSDLAQAFVVVEPNKADVIAAVADSARWQVAIWDAMILGAARKSGAAVLWTEDLNDGQHYDGVVARNPFR